MEITLLKDADWSVVDGEACRVIEFTPMAKIENGAVISVPSAPYASLTLECPKLPQTVVGFICHKLDFQHLWAAFKERGVGQDEEVIICWSKRHLKGFAKLFANFMPRLWVMVCKRGAYELITDPNSSPQLRGEARFLAERPFVDWKPDVFK